MSDVDPARVAAVLNEHEYDGLYSDSLTGRKWPTTDWSHVCDCGEAGDGSDDAWHANHVAAAILTLLDTLDAEEAAAHAPCDEETHSWDHYRSAQTDSYWIRCTRVGPHDEHEDSNTGLRWKA